MGLIRSDLGSKCGRQAGKSARFLPTTPAGFAGFPRDLSALLWRELLTACIGSVTSKLRLLFRGKQRHAPLPQLDGRGIFLCHAKNIASAGEFCQISHFTYQRW